MEPRTDAGRAADHYTNHRSGCGEALELAKEWGQEHGWLTTTVMFDILEGRDPHRGQSCTCPMARAALGEPS